MPRIGRVAKNVIQAKAKEKQQGGQSGILLLQKSEKANRKERLVRNLTNRLEKSTPSVRNLLPQNRIVRNLTRRFLSQGERETSNVYWGD